MSIGVMSIICQQYAANATCRAEAMIVCARVQCSVSGARSDDVVGPHGEFVNRCRSHRTSSEETYQSDNMSFRHFRHVFSFRLLRHVLCESFLSYHLDLPLAA